ncbi:uncharacterized protein LOC130653668 [Hydractinia symbiolongicarpus]|uniref:uncharacterized protein LOC130653668 n=1 Tax=Hydractinia symbiolongicarpus TaxID=13093 RepID=UPI00254F952C|nr:uncharacterized protein LOC130653668 [Hydractinia symbiolongicarpus]
MIRMRNLLFKQCSKISKFLLGNCQDNVNNENLELIKQTNQPDIVLFGENIFIAQQNFVARNDDELSFQRGECFEVLDDRREERWKARSLNTKNEGYIPKDYVVFYNKLEQYNWYFDCITREESNRLLLRMGYPGSFLIRRSESKPGDYTLSLRDTKGIKHYHIKSVEGRSYSINLKTCFADLPALVKHYQKRADGLPHKLGNACERNALGPWEIERDRISLNKNLGNGHYGQVWEGTWNHTIKVAVKTVLPHKMNRNDFLSEAAIMKHLSHPKLVQLYGICTIPLDKPIYIVLELMQKGSLNKYLKSSSGEKLTLCDQVDMAVQVADGLQYLENKGVVHRDIAARNILVGDNNQLKISDFGLSKILHHNTNDNAGEENAAFAIKWTAPEAIIEQKFSSKSDVWSFGILLYEILTKGKQPYPSLSNHDTLSFVSKGNKMPAPNGCPEELYEIMSSCWERNAQERPTFETLKWKLEEFCLELLKKGKCFFTMDLLENTSCARRGSCGGGGVFLWKKRFTLTICFLQSLQHKSTLYLLKVLHKFTMLPGVNEIISFICTKIHHTAHTSFSGVFSRIYFMLYPKVRRNCWNIYQVLVYPMEMKLFGKNKKSELGTGKSRSTFYVDIFEDNVDKYCPSPQPDIVPLGGNIYIALFNFVPRDEGDLAFQKGEYIEVLDDRRDTWWKARSVKTKKEGFIPNNYVALHNSLKAHDWFFDELTKREADLLLFRMGIPGSFIIRKSESKPGDYTLSLRDAKGMKHYHITSVDGGGYSINSKTCFAELSALVKHYQNAKDGLSHKLGNACQRRVLAPSISNPSRSDPWEIARDRISLDKKLGKGHYGEVWEGTWNEAIRVAVKTVISKKMDRDDFLAEATVMKRLSHPKLIQLYAICTRPLDEPIYIILELMPKGSLDKYLKSGSGNTLTLRDLIDMAAQIANGLQYLENNRVVHRDIAARNILVGDNNQVKISDFGLSKILQHNANDDAGEENAAFAIKWTAPEAIIEQKFSSKSDVWSFGILLYEILSKGKQPYPSLSNKDTLLFVSEGNRMPAPNGCSEQLYKIMCSCWAHNAQERPTFETLKWQLEEYSFIEETNYAESRKR